MFDGSLAQIFFEQKNCYHGALALSQVINIVGYDTPVSRTAMEVKSQDFVNLQSSRSLKSQP